MDNSSQWLNKLQRESWNLELLVSGFSIFLMVSAYGPMIELQESLQIQTGGQGGMLVILHRLLSGIDEIMNIIISGLCVHVFFRGLWIGGLGLRSVTGEMDIEKHRYTPYFETFIKRRTSKFEDFLINIDRICSFIFAFVFLMIFVSISLTCFGLFVGIPFLIADMEWVENSEGAKLFFTILVNVYLVVGLIYLIDFVSGGFFKKQKEFEKIYKPIYRLLSWVTLSFLYRNLYYSFISHKLTRTAIWLLVPIFLLMEVFSSLEVRGFSFLPRNHTELQTEHNFYDQWRESEEIIQGASIPGYHVEKSFLPVFIRFNYKEDHLALGRFCPESEKVSKKGILFNRRKKARLSNAEERKALQCFDRFYRIYLDDEQVETDFIFHKHPNKNEMGLLTNIYMDSLSRGKHVLEIRKDYVDEGSLKDTLATKTLALIPFDFVLQK